MRKNFVKRGIGIAVCVAVAILAFGFVTMTLWNSILVAVLGVKAITFVQALGILILSKILFGGFKGRGGCHGGRGMMWKQKMQEKYANMTPEEREKFKAEWKSRCGGRWGGNWGKSEESTHVAD
jgi:Ca2+/H+ antiporter, TMEM165/GDT1 family